MSRFVDSSSSLGGGNRTHVVQHILNLFRRQGEYTKMPECNNPDCRRPATIKYCSKSCAATINNKLKPKRAKTSKQWNLCDICGDLVRGRRHRGCSIVKSDSVTLGEYAERRAVKDRHPSWKNSQVRVQNRIANKTLRQIPCQVCGYSTHVELAHIKPITAFSRDTPIGIVNSPSNLLVLCRNHHWEFDHGVLTLDQIPKRMDPTPGVEPGSAASSRCSFLLSYKDLGCQ